MKRPFEVGDRVEISGKRYIVQRISLLYTVFRYVTDNRTTQAANKVLNDHWIDNFTRANGMHERLSIPAHFQTTFEDIQCLRDELKRFVRDKDNSRDFMPDIDIEVAGLGDLDRLDLHVHLRYRYNWSNDRVRVARRSKFMCALVLALRRLGIRAPEENPLEFAEARATAAAVQEGSNSHGPSPEINCFHCPHPDNQATSNTGTDTRTPPQNISTHAPRGSATRNPNRAGKYQPRLRTNGSART